MKKAFGDSVIQVGQIRWRRRSTEGSVAALRERGADEPTPEMARMGAEAPPTFSVAS